MATQTLRPPYFSEDVAWVPSWLQNLRNDGFNEYVKDSQAPSNQAEKDLAPSPKYGIDVKDVDVLSREEGGYRSCHLFLSGSDSSSLSVAPSPGNVFQFSLHLSSDVDSLFCSTQDLNQSHHAVAPSKALSLQPAQTSVDFGENMHSMTGNQSLHAVAPSEALSLQSAQTSVDFGENMHSMTGNHACEQDVMATFIPETKKKNSLKSLIHTFDSVKQQKEKPKDECFESNDISDAVELSIAASEALVIHDLVKMESVSETLSTEAVLEIALRVKQARLEGLEDGFFSSSMESDCSDSLSDLNDFLMEDAYADIGLPVGVSCGENLSNSNVFHAKGVSGDENYNEGNNKHNDRELTSQLAKFDDKSEQKKCEVNVEAEAQRIPDSPPHSLCGERVMHSDHPDLAANTPIHFVNDLLTSNQFKEKNNTNDLPLSKVTYLAPERFRSRWLGESADIIPDENSRLLKHDPKCVRETSFLTESVDIVPDESSCVLKHDPKRAISSQLSMHCEGSHNKPDEGVLHSQDMVGCSSLSLNDPLCSVVPCSFASEHDNYKTHIDKENDIEYLAPLVSDFEVDNCQRISDKNTTFDCRDEKITSIIDGKDILLTSTEVVEQMSEKLTRVEHTCLKTYSMILQNQDVNQNCNSTPLSTNQSDIAAASLGTRVSESPSAFEHSNENKNEVNHQHLIDQKSIIQITDDKSDELKASELTHERRSPINLNHRTRHRLLGPKTSVNDISIEKNINQYVVAETVVQHQQNNNLIKVQVECNKSVDGHVKVRKQVHFSDKVEELHQKRKLSKLESSDKKCSSIRAKRQRVSKTLTTSAPHMKHSLTDYCRGARNEFIFRGREFLLTGLSSQKERELEALIRNSGGVILYDIPSPPNSKGKRSSTLSCLQLPIILCNKKLQTAKFLYGCAVGASILRVDWLTDCLASGTILLPEKYMILPNRNDMKWTRSGKAVHRRNQKHIFERVGIMLHGKHSFCTKFACIIKHGGGRAFKTLQWLVRSTDEERTLMGAIVVEEKATISRHLKSCALERDIPIMTSSWIIKSLYSGNLIPLTEENSTLSLRSVQVPEVRNDVDMSEEI
ncbi:hypothetical protein MTR_3g013490 [Medicago truncatula]|uniref:BRCT domain-containing protein n=1 Tax=Medicago truncatula TaxID=3880 RepID=G7IVU1_MEDTR|nr:hypothetical protein MTR_3g013490 [Medicago truncatula]